MVLAFVANMTPSFPLPASATESASTMRNVVHTSPAYQNPQSLSYKERTRGEDEDDDSQFKAQDSANTKRSQLRNRDRIPQILSFRFYPWRTKIVITNTHAICFGLLRDVETASVADPRKSTMLGLNLE